MGVSLSPETPSSQGGLDAVRQRFSSADAAGRWNQMYGEATENLEDDHFRRRRDLALFEVLTHLPEAPRKCQVLDLGCGTGPVLAELRRAGLQVEGLDGSPDMLAHARRRLQSQRLSTEGLTQGDCRHTHFPDAHFDTVVCLGVISYLEDYQPVLAEIQRLLKPGGLLVLSFRNTFNPLLWDPVALARRGLRWLLTPLLGKRQAPPFEIGRFLDHREVSAQLAAQGFIYQRDYGIGFGPLRLAGRNLQKPRHAIRFSHGVEALLRRQGWDIAERWLADVSLWVYRKPGETAQA